MTSLHNVELKVLFLIACFGITACEAKPTSPKESKTSPDLILKLSLPLQFEDEDASWQTFLEANGNIRMVPPANNPCLKGAGVWTIEKDKLKIQKTITESCDPENTSNTKFKAPPPETKSKSYELKSEGEVLLINGKPVKNKVWTE